VTGSDALTRAAATARGLKPGSWEAVESLAVLAIASAGTPEAATWLETASRTAEKLRPGTWEAVRALAWLARAERELAA